eukprot:Skav208419  [mRNA]  locus=scaffold2953:217423:217737:- [translate_table: standard]
MVHIFAELRGLSEAQALVDAHHGALRLVSSYGHCAAPEPMVCHGSQQVAACAPRCELSIAVTSEVLRCEHARDAQGVGRGPAVARIADELGPLKEQEHATSLTW